ncbi:TIGR04222 domain-containing membrane protein [Nocardiopsis exhalans]|uniref:TIGR04222 domain-containing membrane protein n=1 Tax=Nocardiopsis exhalans TaxID=163604 RepID=A0ABY5DJ54_9ACTN|nr:TIGR04222 domain-containing membrane protein [Nocardiopsis exhalans]USY23218.1 TIGR04222 domain-containing membrane protein [Nocardiopsis exhalans]
MLLIPLLGALLGLAVGVFPLFKVFRSGRSLSAAVSDVPSPERQPEPEDLTPPELAYLVGGATRVGEVALMDLFLSGRIRRQARGGFFTLVGPSNAYVTEKDPVRRDLVKAFKDRTGLTARGMIQTATFSWGIDLVREKLAGRQLIAHSGELVKVLADFHDGGWYAQKLSYAGWGLTAAGVVLMNAQEMNEWTIALTVLGGVLAAVNGLALGLYLVRGGRKTSTSTTAGREVAREAESTYAISGAWGRAMVREVALNYTAVVGLGLMGEVAGPRQRERVGDSDAAVRVVTHSGSAEVVEESSYSVGEETPEPREGFELDWNSLCEMAQLCSVDGGSGGSSGDSGGSSGDGGGGGDGGS